jgi:dihydroorotate dehydrogenase
LVISATHEACDVVEYFSVGSDVVQVYTALHKKMPSR